MDIETHSARDCRESISAARGVMNGLLLSAAFFVLAGIAAALVILWANR